MATVDANGVHHHYEIHGSGADVVLLHGGLESSESWNAQTSVLAGTHRVVLIDRRGHGRTPDVEGPITYEAMRDDTIACIEALDLAGTHLVGWSDGGIVALMVAIERPDLVGRIVAIGANASSDAYTAETRATLGPDSPLVDLMRADYEQLTPDGADHWPVVLDKIQHLWWEAPLDFTDQLGRIGAVTLVLAGDDDCIEPAHSVEMFQRIPNARLAVIPGGSHAVPLEQPELVNRIILEFLDGPERPHELMPLLPSRAAGVTGTSNAERMVAVTERESVRRDRPWVIRTYSGHSSALASNELYRTNLAKGQTGLSVAFDLPTQTGYDPDDPLARGEVGKVGVPVPHLGEMRTLFDQIPVEEMNTSMTINATAMWLLAMYIAMADERGVSGEQLAGTIQNDIVKEYLSRGTYIFGPEASRRLTVDVITHSVANMPRWNPINVCPYHLQEAGATPVQELAYGLATAVGVLDAVRDSGQVSAEALPEVVGRISFFIDVGIRFVEEVCKMRAFTDMWDRICVERYGVTDEKLRRFRYGVQVNSLGLTEAQPENNVQRIVLEMLGVTLARDSRARAIQLPCWNEALGLPRPWDQQWSLRMQQVLAFETDVLEYGDIFAGSTVIEAKTQELIAAAEAELQWVLDGGGAFAMIDEIKGRLVQSHAERVRRIESGDISVVGVNCFTETEPSPLTASLDGEASILVLDPAAEQEQIDALEKWRADRDGATVERALLRLREVAATDENLMPATIELARAGGTVGEWAATLRDVFGEYRAPTGVGAVGGAPGPEMLEVRKRVQAAAGELGGPVRLLVGKPGLDGHSNGAEQIAVAARDAGMEVVYQGIRLTPEQIAAAARDEDVDVVGLSILSGSHAALVPETIRLIRAAGLDTPVIVGGIIPDVDRPGLLAAGVARIYTPKDFRLSVIMGDIADLGIAHRRSRLEATAGNGSRRGASEPMEKP